MAGTTTVAVVRYAHPDPDNEWDEWLIVRLALQADGHSFERLDASILTIELGRVSQWLEEAARCSAALESWTVHDGARLQTRLVFIEPCLRFAILSGRPIELRVLLGAALLPPSGLRALARGEERWNGELSRVWYAFEVDQHRLEELRDVVLQAVARFPVRNRGKE